MQRTTQHAVPTIGHGTGFRLYLQTELARRCAANAQYSLRSFARHLDVDHSTLSQLIRGRRALSGAMIARLGSRLGLTDEEIAQFTVLERAQDVSATGSARGVRQLARDASALLADPDHRSVLELIAMEEFRPDSRWIARVLNRTVDEVNVLVARLLRLGLVEMTSTERWVSRIEGDEGNSAGFVRFVAAGLAERLRAVAAGSGGSSRLEATRTLSAGELASLTALLGDVIPDLGGAAGTGARFRVHISIESITDTFQT